MEVGVAFLGLDVKFGIVPLTLPETVKGAALFLTAGGILLLSAYWPTLVTTPFANWIV